MILNQEFSCLILPEKGVIFVGEKSDATIFYGKAFELAAELLQKQSVNSDQAAELLSDKCPPHEIYYAFSQFQTRGFIEKPIDLNSSDSKQPIKLKIHWIGIKPRDYVFSGQYKLVDQDPDMELVLTDSYYHTSLESLAKSFQEKGNPWLLMKPTDSEICIGPLFHPQMPGCYSCLLQRLLGNCPVKRFFFRQGHRNALSRALPLSSSSLSIAMEAGLLEIGRYFRNDSPLFGKIWSLDLKTRSTHLHSVIKMPLCSCPAPQLEEKKEEKNELLSTESGYRTVAPEETLKRYEHLISPISGLVTELRSCSKEPIYVYASGFNRAEIDSDFESLQKHFRFNSGGKGLTETQAKASALCEALERYSGVFQGNEERIRASYSKLVQENLVVTPTEYLLFSPSQYENRIEYNKMGKFAKVPEPFDLEDEIEWTPVDVPGKKQQIYFPTQYLYYNYVDSKNPRGPTYFYADSNGCASGNTFQEAIVQGFLELVERDAISIWWFNRLNRPAVDISSFEMPTVDRLINAYRQKGRSVWVIDITHDFSIPTMVAISKKEVSDGEKIICGFGCHFDPSIALSRAVSEMGQAFVSADNLSMDFSRLDPLTAQWFREGTIENQSYLKPSDAIRCKRDYHVPSFKNISETVSYCQDKAKEHGLEFFLLNQTRSEANIPVVKVIIPGMRHIKLRLAPGRLYEVPVKMGWLKHPLHEKELNPIPVIF